MENITVHIISSQPLGSRMVSPLESHWCSWVELFDNLLIFWKTYLAGDYLISSEANVRNTDWSARVKWGKPLRLVISRYFWKYKQALSNFYSNLALCKEVTVEEWSHWFDNQVLEDEQFISTLKCKTLQGADGSKVLGILLQTGIAMKQSTLRKRRFLEQNYRREELAPLQTNGWWWTHVITSQFSATSSQAYQSSHELYPDINFGVICSLMTMCKRWKQFSWGIAQFRRIDQSTDGWYTLLILPQLVSI